MKSLDETLMSHAVALADLVSIPLFSGENGALEEGGCPLLLSGTKAIN